MRFWDASAVIPLCVSEPRSADMRSLAEQDPEIVAWWGTTVECCSAFARLVRENVLDTTGEEQARRVLETLANEWTEIEPSKSVHEKSVRLLRIHPLRAADSLQLASALVWTGGDPGEQVFVCLDQKLRDAARKEGFRILPEP